MTGPWPTTDTVCCTDATAGRVAVSGTVVQRADTVAIVLGIQLGGTLLTVLPWLLPIGAVSLLGSLLYVSGLVGVPDTEITS